MEFSSSSSPSSSPPPPAPPLSLSKSSYPAVHPVSDPAVQSGFSSVPLHSAGDENKPQTHSSTPLSYAASEKTEQFSSSSCKTSPISSPCVDESLKIPTNCDLERIKESSWRNVENEKERVNKTARGAFDDRELAKNDHNQVTGLCIIQSFKHYIHSVSNHSSLSCLSVKM